MEMFCGFQGVGLCGFVVVLLCCCVVVLKNKELRRLFRLANVFKFTTTCPAFYFLSSHKFFRLKYFEFFTAGSHL